MGKMISLSADGKSIALTHHDAGSTSFSLDRQTLHDREKTLNLPIFGQVVRDVIAGVEDIPWEELM